MPYYGLTKVCKFGQPGNQPNIPKTMNSVFHGIVSQNGKKIVSNWFFLVIWIALAYCTVCVEYCFVVNKVGYIFDNLVVNEVGFKHCTKEHPFLFKTNLMQFIAANFAAKSSADCKLLFFSFKVEVSIEWNDCNNLRNNLSGFRMVILQECGRTYQNLARYPLILPESCK